MLNLESIELVLLHGTTQTTTESTDTTPLPAPLPPSIPALRLLRLSSALVATVKLDHTQRATLRGIDINLDVPNLVVSVDLHSAKCLCNLISAYLAITATEPTKSNKGAVMTGKPTSNMEGDGNIINTKSVMQRVLMSDPTLRTLFWLEEEENRKKKKAAGTTKQGKYYPCFFLFHRYCCNLELYNLGSTTNRTLFITFFMGSHIQFLPFVTGTRPTQADYINTITEGGDAAIDGDIDYARIAQLMRQVLY